MEVRWEAPEVEGPPSRPSYELFCLVVYIVLTVTKACECFFYLFADYARSMEKYLMKQGSWETAGSGREYDLYNFMDRTLGFRFDNSAVQWGCQLRELIRNRTGEPDYIRPGDDWYRNPEFGKTVANPRKRGRNGAGYGKYLGPLEMNPYPPGETYQHAHKPYVAPKE